jgi:hypothetical protein
VTITRFDASTTSFWTPMMPSTSTLPARSAFCACTIPTSGLSAGTAASVSPVNGHSMKLMFGLTFEQVRSAIPAEERGRHAGRAGGVGMCHGRVAVLLDLERPRPLLLDRVAQPVQRPDARDCRPTKR